MSKTSVARSRLCEERKTWRKDRPFGFFAKPETNDNGCVAKMAKLVIVGSCQCLVLLVVSHALI